MWSSRHGAAEMNPTSNHEATGSIPASLSSVAVSCVVCCRCSLDLTLLWPWHRQAAVAPIRHLAWEHRHATSATLKKKRQKDKNKNKKKKERNFNLSTYTVYFILVNKNEHYTFKYPNKISVKKNVHCTQVFKITYQEVNSTCGMYCSFYFRVLQNK